MVEAAETLLSELRITVSSLENDVRELASLDRDSNSFDQKLKTTAELVTRALVSVDNLHISKDAAAQALRDGDREKSRKIAVLLARRKNLVKKLNAMGDEVDAFSVKNN